MESNLIIQTAFLGDLLLSVPLIKELKALDPTTPLVVLCRRPFGEVLRTLKLCDEVIEVDKGNSENWKKTTDELLQGKWKWVVSPHESFRTHLLVFRLKAQKKVGFKRWWNGPVFDLRIERPMNLVDGLRQLSLLTLLNPKFACSFSDLIKNPATSNSASLPNRLKDFPDWALMGGFPKLDLPASFNEIFKKPVIFLAPGSQWPTKRWTLQGFSDLAREFEQKGYSVVLVGGREDQKLGEQIKKTLPNISNLCGETTLTEMMALFSRGQLLVCNDSGLMHLASLFNLPTVGIFGPTTLGLGYRPWQGRALVVEKNLNCRPCGKHGHKSCPIGTHECMKTIPANQVLLEAQSLLAKQGLLEDRSSPSHCPD